MGKSKKEIIIDLDDPNLTDAEREIKSGITYKRRLSPDSPLADGLIKMLEHKKLLDLFWKHEITFKQLNQLLKEKGINKQYENAEAV